MLLVCVYPNLALAPIVTEPSLKSGVRRLKIDQGILDEARMNKHTCKAYKIMIKAGIKLL
jgi:hypothetical protein